MAVLPNPIHFKVADESNTFTVQLYPCCRISQRHANTLEQRGILVCRTSHDSGTCGSVSHIRLSLEILSKFLSTYRQAGDSSYQAAGKTQAKNIVKKSAEKPMAMLMGEITRSPSDSVIPLILVMTQKALSVIHEIGLLPAPIAIAM